MKKNLKKLRLSKETLSGLENLEPVVGGTIRSGGLCNSVRLSCFYTCDTIVTSIEVGCPV